MEIKKAILHILDGNSGQPIYSDEYLDLESTLVRSYIEEQISKIHKDGSKKESYFIEESKLKSDINKYKENSNVLDSQEDNSDLDQTMDFKKLSKKIGEDYFSYLIQSEEPQLIDFLMVEYTYDGDIYLGLLFMKCKLAFNHNIFNVNMSMVSQLVPKFDTLPSPNQKIDTYAVINLNTLTINFLDKLLNINGEDLFILPLKILECKNTKSSTEVIKDITKVTKKVAEDFLLDPIKIANKTKQYLMEASTKEDVEIDIEDCVNTVFSEDTRAIGQAKEKIMEVDIPVDMKVDKEVAFNKAKTHKIKTNTGVVISFPSELLNDSQLIEVINKEDGTLDIIVKNISKVTNM